jgi:hypothetical protein
MNFKATKLASLLATLAAAASLTGCFVGIDPGPDTVVVTDPTPVVTTAIPDVLIDAGAQMSADPGNGVGLFVQYQGDGRWDLFTSCDTAFSGAACDFDVVISAAPGDYFSGVMGTDLGADSDVALQDDATIRLVTSTSYGTDGVSFDATAGSTIEVDVLLDGVPQPAFIFAVSGGVVMNGMPSNVVDFTPDAL